MISSTLDGFKERFREVVDKYNFINWTSKEVLFEKLLEEWMNLYSTIVKMIASAAK